MIQLFLYNIIASNRIPTSCMQNIPRHHIYRVINQIKKKLGTRAARRPAISFPDGPGKFPSHFLFIPVFIISYLRGVNDISRGGHLAELQFISLRLNKKKKKMRTRSLKERKRSNTRKGKERHEPTNGKERETTADEGVSEKLRENVVKRYKKIGMEWYERRDEGGARRGENLLS